MRLNGALLGGLSLAVCCGTLTLLGCAKNPPPTDSGEVPSPVSDNGGTAPKAEPPVAKVEPDNKETIAQLEELGAEVTVNGDGKVTAVDTRNAPGFSDENLQLLAGLDALQTLDLDSSLVTDEGLAVLENPSFGNLTLLNLSRCAKLGAESMTHVKTLPKLERLICQYNKDGITNEAMENLVGADGLRVLDIRGCIQVKDEGLRAVAKLPKLVDFKHRGFYVSNDGVAAMAEAPQLRVLMIQDAANVDDEGVKALAPMKNLTNVNLSGSSVEDAGISEGLAGNKLKDLRLRATLVEGFGVAALKDSHETLQYLELNEAFTDDESLKQLGVFKNLETLLLWQTDVSDEGLTVLAELPKLKTLTLKALPEVTDAGMSEVAKATALESLDLSESGISDEGLKTLHSLKSLKTLDVSNTAVTTGGIGAIREAIPGLTVKG